MEKILVVEDDEQVKTGIVELLRESNFEALAASDGSEALTKIKNDIPDLIISDIMMPKMDGYELLDNLQNCEATAAIPVILLSARADRSDIRKGMSIGADDYVTKPFRAVELLDSVNARLKKKRLHEKKWEDIANNFSSYIPHELRTPLVSVLGFSQIVLEEFDTLSKDMLKDFSIKINKASKRLYDRIEKFIVYSDIELLSKDLSMQQVLRKESIPITDDLIKEIIFESFTPENNKNMEYYIDNGKIKITRVYFQILIKEIIDNAIKYSAFDKQVVVSGKNNGPDYILTITDHGIGIPSDELNSLIAAKSFGKSEGGTVGVGFGLIIVKKICDVFDINLRVESEVNGYTRFTITLPASDTA